MNNPGILKVAIDVPLARAFDYRAPLEGPEPLPGSRLEVPFGRRTAVGMVLETGASSDLPAHKIRPATATLDAEPLFSAGDLRLLRFTSDYYHHPIGEVVAAAMPALLRQGKPLYPLRSIVRCSDAGERADTDALARRAPRQFELLQHLIDAGGDGLDTDQLNDAIPKWRRSAKPLLEKGLITRIETSADLDDETPLPGAVAGPSLNAAQTAAVADMRAHSGFAAFLLDGITGSGKTEVYLSLIRDILDGGQQVLILVPEIGLTPQLVERLQTRLAIRPAVLHSRLSDTERLRSWRRAREGQAQLLVGTRSAIFTPMPKLALIVVDEEHDHSLKQQEGLRYSARDLAVVRGKYCDARVILGSATPTLESLQQCRAGHYRHLRLTDRAGDAKPPTIRLLDLNRAVMQDGLSEPLAAAIRAHLADEGQVLLFLNRRGFAPTLICAQCGQVAECARCDARMTVHASKRMLSCHHCGAARPLEDSCTECGARVTPLGEGTERLEDALRQRFADARIERIDSDSTKGKDAIADALAIAVSGEARILVGTQMLSKGHHFPELTLVGVVNADQGLFGTDFRSGERLAQSIIQVAGRAGRESRPGEVLIQTAFPEHPFWHQLIEGGYEGVAADALLEREQSRWPPFTRLALLRAAAPRQAHAIEFLDIARRHAERHASDYLRVLGPVNAPMARRAGRYRAQLLLQSSDRRSLHALLSALRPALEAEPAARRVRWSIDVDPIELF